MGLKRVFKRLVSETSFHFQLVTWYLDDTRARVWQKNLECISKKFLSVTHDRVLTCEPPPNLDCVLVILIHAYGMYNYTLPEACNRYNTCYIVYYLYMFSTIFPGQLQDVMCTEYILKLFGWSHRSNDDPD